MTIPGWQLSDRSCGPPAALRPTFQRTFGPRPAAFERIADDTVVCRCEEVTAGEVRRAVLDGADSSKVVKILRGQAWDCAQGGLQLHRRHADVPSSPGNR